MLSFNESTLLGEIAVRLGVAYDHLYDLINFESNGFNPMANNPRSSARGLIQFVDSTARALGFSDSLDLVNKNPDIISQLPLVEKYLKQFYPFVNKQDLYLSVFYPAYRKRPPQTEFPNYVQEVNPGIKTVQDYIDIVDGYSKKKLMES